MNRRSRLVVVATAVITLLLGSTAFATSVVKMSLRDLAKNSESIVLARVEDSSARYEANKEIYTYITLRVLDPVKGMKAEHGKNAVPDQMITIRQIGGIVANIASVVPGMPKFTKGEEVVVFLSKKDSAGYPWVMGLQQGKYSVVTDDQGMRHVKNELEDLGLMNSDGSMAQAQAKAAERMPLQAFLDGIRTDLNEAGKVQVDPTTPTE